MNINGSAELARSQMLQRQVLGTRNALDTAAQELTSGLKSDRLKATGGNLARLFSIERMIARNAVHQDTISATELRLDVAQEGLGRILGSVETVAVDLLASTGRGDLASSKLHAQQARGAFEGAVATLNAQVAGQSIFAGTATSTAALADAGAILADLDALVAAAPDAATAIAAVEGYFETSPPGDFLLNRYLGSGQDLPAAELGEGQRLDYAVRADAEELIAALRGTAMAAVVAGGAFAGSESEQMAMLREAAGQGLAAKEGLHELRSRVGVAQNAVETAKAQRVGERETYELARTNIVAADPYDAASRFQALQSQLDAIFTVTARLATLRFTNYLR